MDLQTLLANSTEYMSNVLYAQFCDGEINIGGNGCNSSEAGPAITAFHQMICETARAAGLPVVEWVEISQNDKQGYVQEHITYVPVPGNEDALALIESRSELFDENDSYERGRFVLGRFKTCEDAIRLMTEEWSVPTTIVTKIDLDAFKAANWKKDLLRAGGLAKFQV